MEDFMDSGSQFIPTPLGNPIGSTNASMDGQPIKAEVYDPNRRMLPKFSCLVDKNATTVSAPIIVSTTTVPAKKRGRPRKNKESEQSPDDTNSKKIVESTVYADTYADTNSMTYGIINQTDELLRECKQELDYLRSQTRLKGRYHYINDTVSSMGTLLSTKLSAIKEINSTIKTVNDNEYRRFKDMRAMENNDDSKAVMDAYTAFISAPVGAPIYQLPNTARLTDGTGVHINYPANMQSKSDVGVNNYLSHLTPEENLMLHDNNKDIEEVIVYDQATGAKYFQWMNTKTHQPIPNLPISSELTIEDFVIDPRTKLAKNTNLNCIKKVVVLNEGAFNNF